MATDLLNSLVEVDGIAPAYDRGQPVSREDPTTNGHHLVDFLPVTVKNNCFGNFSFASVQQQYLASV